MRRWLAVALAIVAGPACAQVECGASLPGPAARAEDARYVVAYALTPATVAVGAHFVVDFAVCPRAGAPAPEEVRIDATMPEHRHGMNYRPEVTQVAPGLYRAQGMLFHMPGRWDLTFDVVARGRADRLTATLRVE